MTNGYTYTAIFPKHKNVLGPDFFEGLVEVSDAMSFYDGATKLAEYHEFEKGDTFIVKWENPDRNPSVGYRIVVVKDVQKSITTYEIGEL
jgi:hypothetical protein